MLLEGRNYVFDAKKTFSNFQARIAQLVATGLGGLGFKSLQGREFFSENK